MLFFPFRTLYLHDSAKPLDSSKALTQKKKMPQQNKAELGVKALKLVNSQGTDRIGLPACHDLEARPVQNS